MGVKEQILHEMKQNDNPMTIQQLAKNLNQTSNYIRIYIKRLEKEDMIYCSGKVGSGKQAKAKLYEIKDKASLTKVIQLENGEKKKLLNKLFLLMNFFQENKDLLQTNPENDDFFELKGNEFEEIAKILNDNIELLDLGDD